MATFYNIDYYLVNGLQRDIVLYYEEPPKITFILVAKVGKAAVPEDTEDADPELVANNKQ